MEKDNVFLTQEQATQIGIREYGIVPTAKIGFYDEVRKLCEDNTCRSYGTSWACPPAVGSVAACKERCLRYKHMLVFSSCYPLEDSFDFEGMRAGMLAFKGVCDRLAALAKAELSDFQLLSNEGCFRCKVCTYPEPCRHPEKLHHAIEGYGILVSELAAHAGISYNNGANMVTYFGGLLSNNLE